MRPHSPDLTALIAGLLFSVLGGLFLADRITDLELEVRWIWPALLIGLGLALLVAGRATNGADREPPPS